MKTSKPRNSLNSSSANDTSRQWLNQLHMDWVLLFLLLTLSAFGLFILYSAADQNLIQLRAQASRMSLAFIVMLVCAQIPPHRYYRWAIGLYAIGTLLLLCVLIMGHIGKGAQRWLDLYFFRFQPAELLKLALPMALAAYLSERELPPAREPLLISVAFILIPVLLVAKQPDLGTALLIASSGFSILLLAGLPWRLLGWTTLAALPALPALWYLLHDYQRQRVLTFLNPERDPLGSGYHIIQSKIAIGSGGLLGKGWLNGTQAHLAFLPEHATDFIFAVFGEEFGLLGSFCLLTLYTLITARCLVISYQAQDTFSRLLAGGLASLFFIGAFTNIGMVTGLLPVVGVPLPLISYGGTSTVTLLASFGILMSIQTHRRLVPG